MCLFVAAAAVAAWYVPRFIASGGKPWFYQQEFGPAVMTACGRGYVNPDPRALPALEAFLNRTADEITCAQVAAVPTLPLSSMQRAFRYLIMTAGTTWRLQGQVAWSALTPLYGLLYGITIVLAFAIFRQGMGRALATVAAVALIGSTLHLNNVAHLRDYAKAPFVLGLVLCAIRLVRVPRSSRSTLALAAAVGLLTGIGIGFRNDLLVAIPAFLGVFALFLPGSIREQWAVRAGALAVYVLAVYVAMWPMSSQYTTGGGSSTQHLVLLGLTPAFSADLGANNSRLYEVGFEYRDELALAIIDNYADRKLGDHRFLPMYGADYDRTASRVLADLARAFPADLLVRVYASAIRITELPHSTTTAALVVPEFLPAPVQWVLLWKADALRLFGALWPWPFVITLVSLSVVSVRLGLFAALFVFYLSGYPALQFQERHFFHLEFVGWWALGFSAALAGRAALAIRGERRAAWLRELRPSIGWPMAAGRAAAVWSALAVAVMAPLWGLRQYQEKNGEELIAQIAEAPRAAIDLTPVAAGDGRVRYEAPGLSATLPADAGVHASYLVAEIGGSACDAMVVEATQRYQASSASYDFTHSRRLPVPVSDEPVRWFFPAYFRIPESANPAADAFAFAGVELPAAQASCLVRLSRVTDASRYPVLLDMQLPPDWRRATAHATITGVEPRTNPAAAFTFPAGLARSVVKRSLAASPVPFQPADISKVSPTFRLDGLRWHVSGVGGVGGRGPLLYLVEMKARHLAKGTTFVAEGEIEKGGVTFGLVSQDQWVTQLHVVQTGPFTVVIEVPADGDYKVVMANNLRGMSLENRVNVSRAGLVAPMSGGGE